MKKRIINILLVTAFLLLIILPISFNVIPEINPGIKGSPFLFMTPMSIVKLALGTPDETDESTLTPEKYLTYYNKKIFSHDATVTYTFFNGLTGVKAELTVPKEQVETIYKEIYDYMYATYSNSDNFFENESGSFGRSNGNYGDYAWGTDNASVTMSENKIYINAYVSM